MVISNSGGPAPLPAGLENELKQGSTLMVHPSVTSKSLGILMLADGNGDFTRAMGLEFDATGIGLGMRSQRYAAVIEDGIIARLDVERVPGVDVSSCEAVLSHL